MSVDKSALQEWFRARLDAMEASNLAGKHAWSNQIMDVRDKMAYLFDTVDVVSTHTSKSTELPVYRLTRDDGLEVIMRGNYYDWKVSVDSPIPVRDVFYDLFHREEQIKEIYCEGMSRNMVFDSYSNDDKRFTLELTYRPEILYTFLFLLTRVTDQSLPHSDPQSGGLGRVFI